MSKPKHKPQVYAELHRQGLKNTEIATRLGVSEAAVRRGLRKIQEKIGLKMLAVDIETAPALAYIWRVYDENISPDQLIEATEVISWGAKWIGVDGVEFASTFHDGKTAMLRRIWALLDEADVVVHFNGRRFDIPHLQREFLEAGMSPPAPFKQIDLLAAVKSQFRFTSNKLAHVSVQLGLAGKEEHEGFRLWLKCMAGDADAWDRMRAYNIQDVVLLEDMYYKMRPWIPNHPSIGAWSGQDVCPKCGSDELNPRGFVFLSTGRYQRFCCGSCGAWSRTTKRYDKTTVTQVTG